MTCTIQQKLHFNQENISFFNILLSLKFFDNTKRVKCNKNTPQQPQNKEKSKEG